MSRFWTYAATLTVCATLASFGGDDPRPNAPSTDPYTEGGSPELMKAAGYASMGGFKFATNDTTAIDAFMGTSDIRWIETEHFELGFALGSYQVERTEKKKILAELTELQAKLPSIKPKTKLLDPWLRAHLYAQRLEQCLDAFIELIQVDLADFPDGTKAWDLTGTYMGEGPYLGQKGKFEVLILPSEATYMSFLREQFGLSLTRTLRWNIIPEDTLTLIAHIEQAQLKKDSALHGHLGFNLGISFLNSYKHYSYDAPIWLREGIGHFMERRIDPRFNTFDSSEGSLPKVTKKSDWKTEVAKLVRSGAPPRMARLIKIKTYSEMELEDHFTTWSMIDFLVKTHPEEFANFLGTIKGRTDERGYSLATDLKEAHREAFKSVFGWSYLDFDQAWAAWVGETY